MRKILLNRGQHTLVDDADFDMLSRNKWQYNPDKNTGYVCRTAWYVSDSGERKSKTLAMHRVLMGLETGDCRVVDHIDGNGLNNQRYNLRICTNIENARNRHARYGNGSRFKGVNPRKYKDRLNWSACIKYEGKQIHLGTFITELMAATAYNRAARIYFGEFAQFNIIDEVEPIRASRFHTICRKGHNKNGHAICLDCAKIAEKKRNRDRSISNEI